MYDLSEKYSLPLTYIKDYFKITYKLVDNELIFNENNLSFELAEFILYINKIFSINHWSDSSIEEFTLFLKSHIGDIVNYYLKNTLADKLKKYKVILGLSEWEIIDENGRNIPEIKLIDTLKVINIDNFNIRITGKFDLLDWFEEEKIKITEKMMGLN